MSNCLIIYFIKSIMHGEFSGTYWGNTPDTAGPFTFLSSSNLPVFGLWDQTEAGGNQNQHTCSCLKFWSSGYHSSNFSYWVLSIDNFPSLRTSHACMFSLFFEVKGEKRTKRPTVPPATKPDSPSCIATPKPPSLTGAEFSFEANSTQWGYRGTKKDSKVTELFIYFNMLNTGPCQKDNHLLNCKKHCIKSTS